MSKKHFIALAGYLKDTDGYCEKFTPDQLEHLANFCHSMNPRFDKSRWIGFINGDNGPSGGKVKASKAV